MQSALTSVPPSAKRNGMGRNRFVGEQTLIRFTAGTLDRIARVLRPGEKKSDFIRGLVEQELKRRERIAHRSPED